MQTYTRGNHCLARVTSLTKPQPAVRELCDGKPRVSYRQLDTTRGHQRILQVPTKENVRKQLLQF